MTSTSAAAGEPAAPSDAKTGTIAFGEFRLDAELGRLWRGDERVELPPRPAALLLHLASNAGRLVTKDELLDRVWGTVHITEGVIKTAMSVLRRALDDVGPTPRWLETIPRRGYRFVGEVRRLPAATTANATDAAAAADVAATMPPSNLPARLRPLIARDADLATILALAENAALVTLTGAGGSARRRWRCTPPRRWPRAAATVRSSSNWPSSRPANTPGRTSAPRSRR